MVADRRKGIMMKQLQVNAFFHHLHTHHWPLIDVRSPKEYAHAHIPSAINIPLFDDVERANIGKMYKERGKETAVMEGLQTVGPKLTEYVEKALKISANKQLLVHCWRGGMRSSSLGWLWDLTGFEVKILMGGYKAYRHKVTEELAKPWKFIVLGGKTGSGKTALLQVLKEMDEQIIDLEDLAQHKGSVFGGIGKTTQPSTEHFSNLIHHQLVQLNIDLPIWIEDESHNIGNIYLPDSIWKNMQQSPLVLLEGSKRDRIDRLVDEYAGLNVHSLKHGLSKISRRLGDQRFREAIKDLEHKSYASVVRNCLDYYDKAYDQCLSRRAQSPAFHLKVDQDNLEQIARELIHYSHQDAV